MCRSNTLYLINIALLIFSLLMYNSHRAGHCQVKGQAGAGEGRLDANMFIDVYNWLSLETVTKLLIINYNINNCFYYWV